MPTTFCVCTRDNRWISQKLSMEKNTIGNEPYIEKATVLGSFFVLIEDIIINSSEHTYSLELFFYHPLICFTCSALSASL